MTLPSISIPEIPLPIQLTELLHPAIIHFAIAIPVVIFLLEIYNLGAKRKSISAFSFFLLIVVAVVMFGAYLTGGIDGKAAIDAGLSSDGVAHLKEHKLLGTYLVYASLGLLVFKLLFMAIRKTVAKLIFILILGGFIAVTLYQGKEGGELVYEYGANSEAVANLRSDLEDALSDLSDLEESKKTETTKTVVTETTKEETPTEESQKEE